MHLGIQPATPTLQCPAAISGGPTFIEPLRNHSSQPRCESFIALGLRSTRIMAAEGHTAMANRLLLFEEYENNICASMAKVAKSMGFETQEVNTVERCLEAVTASPPDAVLMITNNIHKKCAFDVAAAIRSAHPKCGFVFVAGCEMDGREGFLAVGYIFRVLALPVLWSKLTAAIREAMDSPMETFIVPKTQPSS